MTPPSDCDPGWEPGDFSLWGHPDLLGQNIAADARIETIDLDEEYL